MSVPIRTNRAADDEIFSCLAEYRATSLSVADRLWTDFLSTLRLISDHPNIGEVVPRARLGGAARRVRLKHFRFYVIYRILPEVIEVMAFAHTSRKPLYWRSRFN